MSKIRRIQVNCQSYDCYYNDADTETCKRAGIHASKSSCCCFVPRKSVRRL